MSSYKTQQHRLVHRGRAFHFVSYEGQAADEKHQQPATPPSWYVMLGGKRWVVAPQVGDPSPAELDVAFAEWLESHVFGDTQAVQSQQPAAAGAATLAGPAEALRSAIPAAGPRR
jgi:hypothetical protein